MIAQASYGQNAQVDWQPVVDALRTTLEMPGGAVQYVEAMMTRSTVIVVYAFPRFQWVAVIRGHGMRQADPDVALGLLLSAPVSRCCSWSQEMYEDKRWADDVPNHRGTRLLGWSARLTSR